MCTWGHGVRKFHLSAFLTPPKVPFRAIGEKKGTKHTTPKVSILGRLTSSGEFLQQFFAIFSKKPFLYFFLRSLWMGLLGGLKSPFLGMFDPPKVPLGEAVTNSKKDFHKMVTPPRPPFMKSLFIYFSFNFFSEKRDDFEGRLMGVWRVLQGVWSVFDHLWTFSPKKNLLLRFALLWDDSTIFLGEI